MFVIYIDLPFKKYDIFRNITKDTVNYYDSMLLHELSIGQVYFMCCFFQLTGFNFRKVSSNNLSPLSCLRFYNAYRNNQEKKNLRKVHFENIMQQLNQKFHVILCMREYAY